MKQLIKKVILNQIRKIMATIEADIWW